MKRMTFAISICLFSVVGFCGQLITKATIVEIANTNNNGKDFAVFLENGSANIDCTGGSSRYRVVFPESKMQSEASYNQVFSIALAAYVSGDKVRVHNFENNDCDGANFISISR